MFIKCCMNPPKTFAHKQASALHRKWFKNLWILMRSKLCTARYIYYNEPSLIQEFAPSFIWSMDTDQARIWDVLSGGVKD